MRLSLTLAAVLFLSGLAAPARSVACMCDGQGEGEVAFVGTVMSAGLLQDLLPIGPMMGGTWRFSVESVIAGDPGDGRVFAPGTSCYRSFEVGGTYLVHAEVVDPTKPFQQHVPGVPLVTHHCLMGEEIEPPPAGTTAVRAALSWSLVPLLGLIAALSVSLRRRAFGRRGVSETP